MSWVSYIVPRVIARYSSPYNRDIRVLEEKGKYKILVNGSRQSGEYVQKLWQHAFCEFGIIPSPDIRSILVLGVAGGTVIHLLHAMYPDAVIEGVEIDEKMISIGKKYFGLSDVAGLTLVEIDANAFLTKAVRAKTHWDMILVDTHVGPEVPDFVNNERFLTLIRRALTPRGVAIVNYLRELKYQELSVHLRRRLKNIFGNVRETDIYFNRFFCCRHA
jgi:spermidine synthase